jgi:hypothetical protein
MKRRLSSAVFGVGAIGILAGAGAAQAQTWSPPQVITSGSIAEGVATNGLGTAAIAFGGASFSVQTGGTWSSPVTLSPETNLEANVAVAPNGDVLAVWAFRTTNTFVPNEIQAAFHSGGHWGNTITISSNVYGNVYSRGLPAIGFDGNSNATLIWEEITTASPLTCGLKAIVGTAAAGFGAAQTISTAGTCFGWTRLAVGASGRALAVEGVPGILSGAVVAIDRDASGAWSAPVTVGAAGVYRQRQPKVGLATDGSAVLLWLTNASVRYSVRTGGVWSAPAVLPVLVGGAGGAADLAVDAAGNAVATFTQTGIGAGAYSTYRPAGASSSWQPKLALPSGASLQVVATPPGTFVIGGATVSTRLAGSSTWSTHTFSGASSTLVAAAAGSAIAILEGLSTNLLESSTASVP